MNKRFLSTLFVLGIVGTGFLGGINPVEARSPHSYGHDAPLLPGQRRVKYKISNIADIDVINLCGKKSTPPLIYVGYKREGHQVRCLFVYPTGKIRGNLTVGAAAKKGNFKVTVDITSYNNVNFKPLEMAFSTDDVCEYKHRGMGTYSIEGGNACEDSYRKNPWEQ